MAVKVTIRTSDGKVYTNPRDVHIPRNEKTEALYRMVEQFVPPNKSCNKDKTA